MNEQFIPYEQALELKELGFNEICLTYYNFDGKIELSDDWAFGADTENKRDRNQCLAPLWQQAFDWFRETHDLHTEIRSYTAEKFTFVIQKLKNTVSYVEYGGVNNTYSTYEEAREECLKKLIEVVSAV